MTGGTFRSLRRHNMRAYMIGLLVSNIGTWLQAAATSILVYDLTHRATASGLNAMFEFLPMLLLGPWAGGIADRHNRRTVLFFTQSAMGLQGIILAVVCFTGSVSVPVVYGLSAILGIASAIDNPSRRGLVLEIVPPEDMSNAMSLHSTTLTVARITGPALAAVLVGPLGTSWLFLANGLSYLAVLWALLVLRQEDMHRAPPAPRTARPVREAFAWMWSHRDMRRTFIVFTVASTFAVNFSTVFPKIADKVWHHGNGYATLAALVSVGSLIGALSAARLPAMGLRHLVVSATVLASASILMPFMPTFWLGAAMAVPLGFGMTGLLTTMNGYTIPKVPADMRGRVMALQSTAFLGSTPVGGPITGWIGDHIGLTWSMSYGGILTFASMLLLVGLR